MTAIGDAIRTARTTHGLTQRALATALGVGQSAVGQWETGDTRPSRDMLPKIAAALGLPLDLLLQADGDVEIHPDAMQLAVLASRLDDRTRRSLLAMATAWLAAGER